MVRAEDWQARLMAFIDERRERPFRWGESDCCTFAADAVLAMTGIDPMGAHRGSYASWPEAAEVIETAGGFRELLASLLGGEVPVLMAMAGDVVMVEAGSVPGFRNPAAAIVVGELVAAQGQHGIVHIPIARALAAWRIPMTEG